MNRQECLEYLRSVETPHVVDALADHRCMMDPAIHSLVPGCRLVGPAFTADSPTESVITTHKAMQEIGVGEVLIIDGKGAEAGALWGGCITLEAISKGVAGVVVDGPSRDIAAIRAQKFPVFARSRSARAGTNRRVGLTAVPVTCGGVLVNPGDIVVADDEGIVVIPLQRLEVVVEGVHAVIEKEAHWRDEIKKGVSLAKTIGLLDLIYPDK